MPETNQEGEGLDKFLNRIGSAIRTQLPGSYWVRAEVLKADLSKRNHLSLELVSYDGTQDSKARAVIWSSNLRIVSEFEKSTGHKIKPGLKILFECSVQFRTDFGLSLIVHAIDSRFTLGDMEAKLQAIRNRLYELNEFELNKRLQIPTDYTRVAVISPQGAAGLGDFKSVAERLDKFQLCTFDYYSALFQGPETVNSIVAAISQAVKKHQEIRCYDAIAIVRGGGDKAGLYELNDIRIARCVCRSPIPVLVGIGHERDTTILDELANSRCPTPSIVATTIQERVIGNARNGKFAYQNLQQSCQSHLANSKFAIKDYKQSVETGATQALTNWKALLTDKYGSILREPKSLLQRARHQSTLLNAQISHHSLESVNNSKRLIENLSQSISNNARAMNSKGRQLVTEYQTAIFSSSKYALFKNAADLNKKLQTINSSAKHRTKLLESELDHLQHSIITQSKHRITESKRRVIDADLHIRTTSKHMIEQEKSKLRLSIERVLNLDPNKVLERGFALIKRNDNRIITSASDTTNEETVRLVFKDGETKAKIME